MDMRTRVADAVYARMPDAADQPATTAARIVDDVMGIVEEETRLLRRELAVARGETVGSVPTWAEYAAAERAKEERAARDRPKPRMTLEEARRLSAVRGPAEG